MVKLASNVVPLVVVGCMSASVGRDPGTHKPRSCAAKPLTRPSQGPREILLVSLISSRLDANRSQHTLLIQGLLVLVELVYGGQQSV
ncbi:hypothetical protein F5Y18DRAFT_407293 [Xylariaceae sp. FL1019]|nr:hypothetical protein F5Y18DRAFT_407293 [Xylariaceae sp. FL1019]